MIGPRWDWPREGLARFDGISWELVKLLPSPPAFEGLDLAFGDIAIAPNGDVWVTIVGSRLPSSCCADMAEWRVGRFDGSSWTFYGAADGLWSGESGQFLQLAITADGRAWVSNDGLAGFDGARWTISLPGTLPGLLAASPDGGLWASGEVGVVRIGLPKT